MGRLLTYMRPYRKQVSISVAFLVVNSVLQVTGPMLTKVAVDRYLSPNASPTPWPLDTLLPADPWHGLAIVSLLYATALLLAMLCEFVQGILMQWTGQHAMFDLRRELMAHLQKLDIAYYDKNPVGRLLTRVTTDVDVLSELFSSSLINLAGDLLTLAFVVAAMLRLSPSMTGLLLAVLPFVVLVTIAFRRAVQSSNRRIRLAVARINAYLQEHITGIAVLQLFNREDKSAAEFTEINRSHMEAYKDSILAYGWFYPAVEFLSMLALAALLAYGGFRIRGGELSAGILVAFLQYGMRFFRPIQDLSEKYNILQSAMAASERIFSLLDTPFAAPHPEPRKLDAPGAIEFDHVWFAYKDEDWVLKDVSFVVEPGETVAVVGHTGAGKTTLTNLILRFYDIQKGAIRIGGIDIREFDPRELRRHFAVVLQDPFLFSGTIAQNIRLGTARITAGQVREAAERVNLLDFVEGLPNGFDHEVRERGASLSTGQKQLINFARALAHNPWYLILDEATSSVDTATELRIRQAVERLVENRTSIIIAHRLSTIQKAGRILVMHKAELREAGSHQQLLALRGIYFKLYQLQYKDQEIRAGAAEADSWRSKPPVEPARSPG